VERQDAEAVYALLDEEARMGMDREAFAAWFARHQEAIQEQARELAARAGEDRFQIDAVVPVSSGQEAQAGWFAGGWYLTREAPARAAQGTPREALEALLAALREEDAQALLRLMSAARRAEFLREMELVGVHLEESLEGAIITQGDSAELLLKNGDRVRLAREDGLWKISGYEAAPREAP
jgi:hypothetical protein